MRSIFGFVLGAVLIVGCASTGTRPDRSAGNPRLLTAEQIANTQSRNLYDVVNRLRPEWLGTRGVSSATAFDPQTASVYMGGSNLGDIQALRDVATEDVAEVRYFTAAEAIARFGMGHPRGVIEVIRR